MNHRAAISAQRILVERFLLWSLALIVSMALVAPVRAAEVMIDTITIRLRDDALPRGALTLSAEQRAALGAVLRNSVTESGRTRDGALRLTLAHPVPFVEARDAINRVRLLPEVLYASVDASMHTFAQKALVPAQGNPPQRPVSQLIIKYRDPALTAMSHRNEALPAARLNRLTSATGKAVAHLRAMSGGAWVVQLFQPVTEAEAQALARSIEADPEVEYAEPDLRAYPLLVPNDPSFAPSQWDLKPPATSMGGANLPGAWDITTGSASLVVAVLDTGILPHPDLAGRTVAGYDMLTNSTTANDGGGRDSDPTDPGDWTTVANECGAGSGGPFNSSWHGTHVSGTIGALTNNGVGIAGINWVSKIQPVRVLGHCGGPFSDINDAIVWAAGGSVPGVPANATPARVINMSLGGGSPCPASMQTAINSALTAGTVVVVSAGNGNTDASGSAPANCVGVITVAATQAAGARSSYSNFGAAVEIAAPGGGDGNYILSTLNSGAHSPDLSGAGWIYALYQGTSMAAPHVAGIASLMKSANAALTPAQVLSKIQTSARAFPTGTVRDCTSNLGAVTATIKYCGAGIVDAAAAVLSAGGGGATPTTTTLGSSPNPSTFGASVTFTATVNGTNPTGTVDFKNGASSIASCGTQAVTGAGNSRTATCITSTLAVGAHSITATYSGDPGNQTSTSSPPLSQVVNGVQTNVALAANGGVASASSTFSANYPVAAVNNGDRTGAAWAAGGGWNDATAGVFSDYAQIVFNGWKTIDQVIVYSLQDVPGPVEPTDVMTFSQWGITAFTVQGWNGANWVTLGTISGNNLVKRTVSFGAFTTDRIRINVTNALNSYSRIVEIEAFGLPAATMQNNVAAAALGGVASASSTYSASFPEAAVNNGDRTGAAWGAGGGWNDATVGAFPDFVQIVFSGQKTIDRVIVYTLQDNFWGAGEPSDITTFSLYGITDFTVQGWNGVAWVTLGTVSSGFNLVKRTVNFSAFATDRIRVNVTNALNSYSRIVEIEAWGN